MKRNKNAGAGLEGKRPTFFLVGLVLALLGVYGLLNLRHYAQQNPGCDLSDVVSVDEDPMPITRRFMPEEKQSKKEEVKKETKKVLGVTFIEIANSEPDPIEVEDEPLDEIPDVGEEIDIEVIMDALDKKPVFPGCEDILDEKQRYDCFVQNVRAYVAKNMKPCDGPFGVIQDNLIVSFVITNKGEVTGIEVVRGEDECNKNKAKQVIKTLPKMQPGQYMGKAVKTRFTLPINIRQN